MPGPLSLTPVLMLFPFRFRDLTTGRWVKARYVAERHVIAQRYREWEIIGPPEIRKIGRLEHFNPWRCRPMIEGERSAETDPALRDDERSLVLLFLRRYVAYCARRRRFAQMEGAAKLFRELLATGQ